ncbi:hypothetical protein TNCV_789561 [Trichonephila clavipes]|nr:hypothetical protein TNCV_789561 [Trichonephila clavipes]
MAWRFCSPTCFTSQEPKSGSGSLVSDDKTADDKRTGKEATRGLLATDHVILNHGQVTWMTPELAPPSPNYHTTPTGGEVTLQSNTKAKGDGSRNFKPSSSEKDLLISTSCCVFHPSSYLSL